LWRKLEHDRRLSKLSERAGDGETHCTCIHKGQARDSEAFPLFLFGESKYDECDMRWEDIRLRLKGQVFQGRNISLFLLVICCLIACYPLFHDGFYMGHDWPYELTRAADYSHTLKESGFPVRWSPNLEAGYGSPIYLFFPPLSLTLFSIPIMLGCPLVTSMKIVLFVLAVAGGVGMYLFSRFHFGNMGGLLSACLYELAPYHFVDLFTRNAIAEFTALSVAPFLFYAVAAMVNEERPGAHIRILFIGSAVFFTLSHVLSLLMYLPLVFLYLAANPPRRKKSLFLSDVTALLLISACLASFFILPMLWELKYIQTWQLTIGKFDVMQNFVTLKSLLIKDSWFSVTPFSAILLIFVSLSTLTRWRVMSRLQRTNICLFAGYLVLCVFMMTDKSALLWKHSELLRKFQFPWRLLSPATFALCFICGSLIMVAGGHLVKRIGLVAAVIVVAAAVLMARFPPKEGSYVHVAGIDPGTIRSRNLKATVLDEYRPVWGWRSPAPALAGMLVSSDPRAVIKSRVRRPALLSFRVLLTEDSVLTAHIYYFPGWKIYRDGKEVPFDVDSYGLPRFGLPAGEHLVDMKYENTWDRATGNIISLLGLIALAFFGFKWYVS
jgi:hypothetical protein